MEKMTRREALGRIYRAIVAAGASSFVTFDDLLAAEAQSDKRLNVVWLHGSSCSGCSCALLDIEYVPVLDILTKFTNIVFHPDLSLATGDQVSDIIDRLLKSDLDYLFVLEGGIPTTLPHACLMGDKPMTEWVEPVAKRATAAIGAGTCAALGGIPAMYGTTAGSKTLEGFLAQRGVKTPVVNLPGCPMKPEHFVYTVLHYAMKGSFPEVDGHHRPTKFFGRTLHERCIYYADFQEKNYARFIGDRGCMLKLGCQGPVTRYDCLVTGYNNNTSNCIKAGHPCVGCASEQFPRQIMYHSYGDKRAIKNRRGR